MWLWISIFCLPSPSFWMVIKNNSIYSRILVYRTTTGWFQFPCLRRACIFAIFSFACHFYRHVGIVLFQILCVWFGVDRVPIVRHILFGGERKMLHYIQLHFRTRLDILYMWVIKFWTVLVLATDIYILYALIVLFCGIAVTVHWFFLSFQFWFTFARHSFPCTRTCHSNSPTYIKTTRMPY